MESKILDDNQRAKEKNQPLQKKLKTENSVSPILDQFLKTGTLFSEIDYQSVKMTVRALIFLEILMLIESFYLLSSDKTSTYIISCISGILFLSTIIALLLIRKIEYFQTNYRLILNGIMNLSALFIILTDPICLEALILYEHDFIYGLHPLFLALLFSIFLKHPISTKKYLIMNLLGVVITQIIFSFTCLRQEALFELILIELSLFLFVFNLINENSSSEHKKIYIEKESPINTNEAKGVHFSYLENLLTACDSVKSSLSLAGTKIQDHTTRQKLLHSIESLKIIKDEISRVEITNLIIPQEGIDDEDRDYLEQNYIKPFLKNPNYQNQRRKSLKCIMSNGKEPLSRFYPEEKIDMLLKGVGTNWNFDIWLVHSTAHRSLNLVAKYVFSTWKIISELKLDPHSVDYYFSVLESEYRNNPYHNACHACDVLNSMLFFITHSELGDYISIVETMAACIAALGHDVGHPGVNNRYLVNSSDELAIRYNDISVLENMHASLTFRLMEEKNCDILGNLSSDIIEKVRKIVISMILETDMSRHFSSLNTFKARISAESINLNELEDKLFVLTFALKCADLGHAGKSIDIHKKWTKLICTEFFMEGDLEIQNGLPLSMYCNRKTTNIAKSESGFIKNICLPLYSVWCSYLRNSCIECACVETMKENLSYWEEKEVLRMGTPTHDLENRRKIQKFQSM